MEKFNFGYKPSKRDPRDYIYSHHVGLTPEVTAALPSSYLPKRIPIRDQGPYGTCGGHAGAYLDDLHNGGNLSPLYAYTKAKQLEGDTEEGVEPVSIAKVLTKFGDCQESLLSYNLLTDVHVLPQIPAEAEQDASTRKATSYAKVQTIDEIKHSITSGQPVLLGVIVTESFMYAEGGVIPLPNGNILGGHLICGDGFDDNMSYIYPGGHEEKGFVRIVNSWGEAWGDKGYGWIPYSFFSYTDSKIPYPYFLEGWSVIASNPVPAQTAETVTLHINDDIAMVDGRAVKLDVAPKLENNRTMVPVRFLMETFGLKVDWNEQSQTVTIRRG